MEWKTRRSEVVFDGKRVKVRRDVLLSPEGREVVREVVSLAKAATAAAALTLKDDGRVVLVRQYRHPAGRELLEIPAGVVEPGETPEDCIARELVEETGYEAADIRPLLEFYPSPGIVSERIHVFIARALTHRGDAQEEDEGITVVETEFEEALRMVRYGEITDAKTVIALLAARRFGLA